jgi:beta-glucanase (GH16 family)
LNLSGYKLTFDDEFNTFSNSPSGNGMTWSTTLNGQGLRSLPSNGEQEFYSDSSVGVNPFSLQNGALTITASPGSNPYGLPNNSGAIDTANGFNQQYGYFEMRAQLPQGKGMWPAFWLLTKGNWPPELDPLEAFGAPNANGEGGSTKMHYGAISHDGSQSAGNWVDTGKDLTAGYHTYGVQWDPSHLTYYVDGQQIAQVNTPSDAHVPMYMIANLAAGGNWPGSTAGETAQMKIDYIRAYSNDSNAKGVALDHVSAPDGHDPGMYGASASNASAGSTPTPSPAPTPAPAPAPAPSGSTTSPSTSGTPSTTGSGSDTLTLHLSEDAWQGDAQFSVTVDGKQLGGAQSVTASHGAGQTQDFTFKGDFGAGTHQVAVKFLNDGWGGTAGTDRNLYVDGAEFNGQHVATSASLMYNGATDSFAVTGSASGSSSNSSSSGTSSGTQTSTGSQGSTSGSTSTASSGTTSGSGADTLTLHLAEDAYQGDAQFTVKVDGKQLGAAQSVTASHGAGQTQDFTFHGDFGAGTHQVAVSFVNDAWGGTAQTDRNLYVAGAEFNGQHIATAATLMSTGATDSFSVSGTASSGSTSAPAQTAGQTGSSTSTTVPADGSSTVTGAAHATPTEARGYVVPDASGTAHGTAGAEDIYATAGGQTLIGGGGDDVFHIGTHTDAHIVTGTSGVTTVSTWAGNYTLASGVDNLEVAGNYAHNITGNGRANYIVGSDANDTIHGGGGNVTIAVGTGANDITGGGQHDTFVFSKAADHDNVIHDFTAGHDLLDLKGAVASTGYSGADAVADHVLSFVANSSGGTNVMVDPDGSGSQAAHTVVTLEHILPSALKAGVDYVWH